MSKEPVIWIAKPSRLGDQVCYLPFLTYIKKIFPKSYITFFVDKNCWQITNFLYNHPYLDKLQISAEVDNASFELQTILQTTEYNFVFHPYPRLTRPDYFNYWSVQKENFIMSEIWDDGQWRKIAPSEYDILGDDERYPKLTAWFKIERFENTVAIWPFAGVANNDPTIQKRSPSIGWWKIMVRNLHAAGYKIAQYGHPKSDFLEESYICDRRHLSLFDAVVETLGCNLSITTDSGSSHLINAYGHRSICLYSNYLPGHVLNHTAMTPMNFKNDLFLIHNLHINNIEHEKVMLAMKVLIKE